MAETGIDGYEAAIGSRLRARTLSGQQDEAALAVEVLNRMIRTAKRLGPGRLMPVAEEARSPRQPPCTSALELVNSAMYSRLR